MNKSQLRQIIKEEIKSVLNEAQKYKNGTVVVNLSKDKLKKYPNMNQIRSIGKVIGYKNIGGLNYYRVKMDNMKPGYDKKNWYEKEVTSYEEAKKIVGNNV